MNRRILLAGGDATELDEIQTGLAHDFPDWEIVRARSGADAINCLTAGRFDAVLADLHLDGLSGLQLANHVSRQWPRTHRILLADLGDLDSLLRCVGISHQFLARPCDAHRVRSVLERAFQLEAWLPQEAVQRVLGNLPKLPSTPAQYGALVTELERDPALPGQADQLVMQDPAMAAKTLQLVNSAAYGLPLDEADPAAAVRDLGVLTMRRLLLLAHSYSAFKEIEGGTATIEALVYHSRRTSCLAHQIAVMEGAPPDVARQAATAGLLHDVGKIALAANAPDGFRRTQGQLRSGTQPDWEVEHHCFGVDHAEVGGCILAAWGLPIAIIEAVSLHHHPTRILGDGFRPLTAVHAANVIDRAATLAEAQSRIDRAYLGDLGLTHRVSDWWAARESCT
jgi:putative nucleotidyltransferase with HDIG domain